ncbi:MAG: hypothetical protein H7251_07880 [Acetobacteraceae bacterium]|nr:hypothetical protein [Acetobacteraceae bacterium]
MIQPASSRNVAAVAVAVPVQAAPSPMHPNPSYHIDPALNMVVIEFISARGQIISSLPTPQQLDAYQRAGTMPNTPQSSLLVKT